MPAPQSSSAFGDASWCPFPPWLLWRCQSGHRWPRLADFGYTRRFDETFQRHVQVLRWHVRQWNLLLIRLGRKKQKIAPWFDSRRDFCYIPVKLLKCFQRGSFKKALDTFLTRHILLCKNEYPEKYNAATRVLSFFLWLIKPRSWRGFCLLISRFVESIEQIAYW